MTTAELASRLLPSDLAGRMASHEFDDPLFGYESLGHVQFFARPEPLGDDLCRRQTVYVDMNPIDKAAARAKRPDIPVEPAEAEEWMYKTQVVAAPGCRLRAEAFFAWVQPMQVFDDGVRTLRRLISIQNAARGETRLAPAVTCKDVLAENKCDRSPQAIFADLPLDQIYIIQPGRVLRPNPQGWEISVMPNGPGKRFWEVRLPEDAGNEQRIEIIWKVPPPF